MDRLAMDRLAMDRLAMDGLAIDRIAIMARRRNKDLISISLVPILSIQKCAMGLMVVIICAQTAVSIAKTTEDSVKAVEVEKAMQEQARKDQEKKDALKKLLDDQLKNSDQYL